VLIATAPGSTADYVKPLEETNTDQEARIRALNGELLVKDEELKSRVDEVDQLGFDKQRLQSTLDQLSNSRQPVKSGFAEEILKAFVSAIKGLPTPYECLRMISDLFPERVSVLDSA